MRRNRTLRTWIAALLLGALGFAQASVSLAACSMERGSISEVLAAEPADACDCGTAVTEFGPRYANRCLAHCTSDLQLSSVTAVITSGLSNAPMLFLPRATQRAAWRRWAEAAPAASVPKRIQLHSFLV